MVMFKIILGWVQQHVVAAIVVVVVGAVATPVILLNVKDELKPNKDIKEEVKQAYKELKGQLQPKLKVRARTFGLMPQAEEVVDDVEVEVTREYDEDGLAYYQVTI